MTHPPFLVLYLLVVSETLCWGQQISDSIDVGTVAGEEQAVDVGGGLTIPVCWCPPGNFLMGSPTAERGRWEEGEAAMVVRHSQGFWIGKHEITQHQWQEVLNGAPSAFTGNDLPVENVDWDQAITFCKSLTARAREIGAISGSWEFTIPSEAQWEYACRAGSVAAFGFGDDDHQFDRFAWYVGNANGVTHPVGQKVANMWGVHDMHGNVREWCLDSFQLKLLGGVDPIARNDDKLRAIRGGCFVDPPHFCRSAFRSGGDSDLCAESLGLRVVLVASQGNRN